MSKETTSTLTLIILKLATIIYTYVNYRNLVVFIYLFSRQLYSSVNLKYFLIVNTRRWIEDITGTTLPWKKGSVDIYFKDIIQFKLITAVRSLDLPQVELQRKPNLESWKCLQCSKLEHELWDYLLSWRTEKVYQTC